MKNLFILPFFIFLLNSQIFSEDKKVIIDQQKDLESIRKEVKQSQQRLDSLKAAEMATQKQISNYDQKITTNQKVIKRLNNQLNSIHSEVKNVDNDLKQKQELLNWTTNKYMDDLRQFYLSISDHKPKSMWDPPGVEIEQTRQSVYLASLASFESENINQAIADVTLTSSELDSLANEKERVSTLKKDKEVATTLEENRKRKEEKSLESVRREKYEEGDRIMTLKQVAEEIERILARLEKEREERQRNTNQEAVEYSAFSTLKGQLLSPVKGNIVTPFGSFKDPVTRLESFSPGITIQSHPEASVFAVAAGSVAYVGNLRGYGNFIIINHDELYYTTYGGLGQTYVSQGEYITSGTKIAVAGNGNMVKFELRKRREPLDPVEWIQIDSF
ncbi:MAG: peptidoglycan DD-metalloendopeptidase family protein [bacterium]